VSRLIEKSLLYLSIPVFVELSLPFEARQMIMEWLDRDLTDAGQEPLAPALPPRVSGHCTLAENCLNSNKRGPSNDRPGFDRGLREG
jgi:hypothetical protein